LLISTVWRPADCGVVVANYAELGQMVLVPNAFGIAETKGQKKPSPFLTRIFTIAFEEIIKSSFCEVVTN
jgi:hypothetical protein